MPGFFATFMLLTAASAWCRYLAATRGPAWILWVPGPGGLVWLLGFVYAAASLSAGPPDTAGLEAAEASRLVLEATHERLTRAHMAAGIAQWTAIATVLATVGVTAWAWSRPAAAPGAEEAG